MTQRMLCRDLSCPISYVVTNTWEDVSCVDTPGFFYDLLDWRGLSCQPPRPLHYEGASTDVVLATASLRRGTVLMNDNKDNKKIKIKFTIVIVSLKKLVENKVKRWQSHLDDLKGNLIIAARFSFVLIWLSEGLWEFLWIATSKPVISGAIDCRNFASFTFLMCC